MQEIYAQLRKPFFAAPRQLFRPVWFFMFFLMIIAVLKLYLLGWRTHPGIRVAMLIFIIHTVFDSFFLELFFGKQKRGLASLDVLMALIFLAISAYLFFQIDPLAGYLLIPGVVWLIYLTILCAAVWYLNR